MNRRSRCLVQSRLLGVIEAEQTEKGETSRNDRLIAVASKSPAHVDLKSISNPKLLDEIEHFFVSDNAAKGKPLSRSGPERARKLMFRGERAKK